ncbi:hypothetical protein CLAIMM_13333, partial [Cladophialophora immunda]
KSDRGMAGCKARKKDPSLHGLTGPVPQKEFGKQDDGGTWRYVVRFRIPEWRVKAERKRDVGSRLNDLDHLRETLGGQAVARVWLVRVLVEGHGWSVWQHHSQHSSIPVAPCRSGRLQTL